MTEASEVRRRGRQRLIGAIALVAVLVVFVPMVLDSEPRSPRSDTTLSIPAKDTAPPLAAPPPAQPEKTTAAKSDSPKVDSPRPDSKKAEAPKVAALETKQVSPPAPASAMPPPAPAAAAGPKLVGFAVQVGAFRDESKLAQARQKLSAAGVAHYTERLDAKAGDLTRLRAGPFPTREAAEAALATLKRQALEGKVVPLP